MRTERLRVGCEIRVVGHCKCLGLLHCAVLNREASDLSQLRLKKEPAIGFSGEGWITQRETGPARKLNGWSC